MDNPRKARVVEQHFLNLPGFHAGAYIRAYVEDTTGQPIGRRGNLPTPLIVLELADCTRRIELEFELCTAADRLNAFHKIDTLIASLQAFREGLVAEAALPRRRVDEVSR